MKKLTTKQKVFIEEYCRCFNGTQSAIKAKYSKKTANRIATENLSKPVIQEAIQEKLQKREEKAELKVADLQRYLVDIISAKTTDIVHFNESGVSFVKNSDELPENLQCALESIEVIESHHGNDQMTLRTKVKLHDKLKALELYGKTIGAFREIIEGSGFKLVIEGKEKSGGKP